MSLLSLSDLRELSDKGEGHWDVDVDVDVDADPDIQTRVKSLCDPVVDGDGSEAKAPVVQPSGLKRSPSCR